MTSDGEQHHVAMALIEGSTPRRIRPQTSTGTLSSLPMLNQVTTNSSSDSATASSAAPTSDGPDQRQA